MNTSHSRLAAFLALLLGVTGTWAEEPAPALKGYDVVGYFVDSQAEPGTPEFRQDWDEGRYQFASAAHRALFVKDPERYLPQFSGLCATGVGLGKKVAADPTVWKIVDGKLYVFYSVKAREMADKDPALLERSHQNWQSLK